RTCHPAESCVEFSPPFDTSSARTVRNASFAVVETNSRAATGPPRSSACDRGRSYESPVWSFSASFVSHGEPLPSPAVHCTVERVHVPGAGCHGSTSGDCVFGATGRSVPGFPIVAGPPRKSWRTCAFGGGHEGAVSNALPPNRK